MLLENTFLNRIGIDKILNVFQMSYKRNSSIRLLNKIRRVVTEPSLLY